MKKCHRVLIVTFVIAIGVVLMVGASYFGYEYKSGTHRKPEAGTGAMTIAGMDAGNA